MVKYSAYTIRENVAPLRNDRLEKMKFSLACLSKLHLTPLLQV